ncbi:MAG: type II secretion system protein [Acidobacteriota bacterium]
MKTTCQTPSSCGGRGFTVLELLIVVAIVGILANLALPAFRVAMLRARATAIVGDFRVIETAAKQYYADTAKFPPEGAVGKEPTELAPYIQGRVRWDRGPKAYRLAWENWSRSGTTRCRHASTRVRIGISIVTTDKELVAMLVKVSPKPFYYTLANTYTYVVEPCS